MKDGYRIQRFMSVVILVAGLFILVVGFGAMTMSEFYPEFVSTTTNFRPDCPDKVNPGPECIASFTTTIQYPDGRIEELKGSADAWIKARQAANRQSALRILLLGTLLSIIGLWLVYHPSGSIFNKRIEPKTD